MNFIKKMTAFLIRHKRIAIPAFLVCFLAVAFTVGYIIGTNIVKDPTIITIIDDPDVPLGPGGDKPVYVIGDQPPGDYTALIQNTFNEASKVAGVVEFINGAGKTYRITKTLLIPSNISIVGNGVTLQIDTSPTADGSPPFTLLRDQSRYREFAMMTEGFPVSKIAAVGGLTIEGVNFVMRNDGKTSDTPRTLLGIGFIRDVTITNCTFSVYSNTRQFLNALDIYTTWENIVLSNNTFTIFTDSVEGGVWVRNLVNQGFISTNMTIENNKFYNRCADEVLTVYAQSDGIIDGIYIRNNSFEQTESAITNPNHFITLGETGHTRNVYFENNYIHMDKVTNSVIKVSSVQDKPKGTITDVFIRGNTIVVDDIRTTSGQIITSNNDERNVIFENNDVTVNTKTGIKKHAVQGISIQVLNNRFKGNGYNTICNNVRVAKDNRIDSCDNGFVGVVDIIGNTVGEATNNMIQVNNTILSTLPGGRGQVNIIGNDLTSSCRAIVHITSTVVEPVLNMENNTFTNVRINNSSNPTATFNIDGNNFTLGALGDINTSSRTKSFKGNTIVALKEAKLLTEVTSKPAAGADAAVRFNVPSGSNSFDLSVPADSVVWFELANGSAGFEKTQEGSGKDKWQEFFKQDPADEPPIVDDESRCQPGCECTCESCVCGQTGT